jgi:hypothetical protein
LNVHNVSDVRKTEIHTYEPLVPGPSHLEVKIGSAKLKKYKSPGSDEIAADFIQAGCEILLSAMHKLVPFGMRKNFLIRGRSVLLHQFTKKRVI